MKNDPISAALAHLASCAIQEELNSPIVSVIQVKEGETKKAPKKARSIETPSFEAQIANLEDISKRRQDAKPLPMPEAGSLGAVGFLKLWSGSTTRKQRIFAIAAFIGYNIKEEFSVQELTAKQQAQREIRLSKQQETSVIQPYQRHGAAPTISGYVAGAVNSAGKRKADLEARERLCAERMMQHEILAQESLNLSERDLHRGLMLVEQERIQAIRRDLSKIL